MAVKYLDYTGLGQYDTKIKEYITNAISSRVPTTRTVNSKALSSNITLSYSDVKALPNYSIKITHNTSGQPLHVKFLTVDYSANGQYEGIYIKLGVMSCHPDGYGYQYLDDIIIGVRPNTDTISCQIYKYIQSQISSQVDGVTRYFGDVYYVLDTTNKIVDFYICVGQYTSSDFTPYMVIGSTSKKGITQHSGTATYYSTGTKVWATGCGTTYARKSDIPTKTSQLTNDSGFITNSALANYVTTNTAQTITSVKTFYNEDSTLTTSTRIILKGEHLNKTTNPSSNRFMSIDFQDKNGTTLAKFSTIQTNDGYSGFLAGAGTDPTSPSNNLMMLVHNSSNAKLLLIPATTTHNYCAVRRDFYNNNTVTLSGNQTISGAKTFTGLLTIGSLASTDATSINVNSYYGTFDITSYKTGNIECGKIELSNDYTNGSYGYIISAFDNVDTYNQLLLNTNGLIYQQYNSTNDTTTTIINASPSGYISFYNSIETLAVIPTTDNTYIIGTSNKRYNTLYLSNKISDGTNDFSLPTTSGRLALQSEIPSTSNFVDLSSAQTITGVKTFSNGLISSSIMSNTIEPEISASGSLGSSSRYWNSLYLSSSSSATSPTIKVYSWQTAMTKTINVPAKDGTMALTSDIPSTYLKSASVSGDTLTLTKQDDTTVTFTASGGGGGDTGIPYINVSASSQTLDPNKFYDFGSRGVSSTESLTVTFGTAISGIVNEYMGEIVADEYAVTLNTPSAIRWAEIEGVSNVNNSLTLEPKYTYQFNVLNNLGLIVRWANGELLAPVLTRTGTILSWDAVTNADNYIVSGTGDHTTTTTNTSFDLSTWYSPISQLATPSNITLSATANSITASWDAVPNALQYTVYYKQSSASQYGQVTVSTNSATLTNLNANTSYDIYVVANNVLSSATIVVTAHSTRYVDASSSSYQYFYNNYTASNSSSVVSITTLEA